VIGRIRLETDSIRTIKNLRAIGVPKGTKCVNMWLVIFVHPNSIKISHRGIAIVIVITKWLVEVKI